MSRSSRTTINSGKGNAGQGDKRVSTLPRSPGSAGSQQDRESGSSSSSRSSSPQRPAIARAFSSQPSTASISSQSVQINPPSDSAFEDAGFTQLTKSSSRTWREVSTKPLVEFFLGFAASSMLTGAANVSTNYAVSNLPLLGQSAVEGVGPYFCAGVVLPLIHKLFMDEQGIVNNKLNFRPILWKNAGLHVAWSTVACGLPVALDAIFGDYLASAVEGMSIEQAALTREFVKGLIGYFGAGTLRVAAEYYAKRCCYKVPLVSRNNAVSKSKNEDTMLISLDPALTWRELSMKPAASFCLALTMSYLVINAANVTTSYSLTQYPLLAQGAIKGIAPYFCGKVVIPVVEKLLKDEDATVNHDNQLRPKFWVEIGSGVAWSGVACALQVVVDAAFGDYLAPYVVGMTPGQAEITRQFAKGAIAYFGTELLRTGLGFFGNRLRQCELNSYKRVIGIEMVDEEQGLQPSASR